MNHAYAVIGANFGDEGKGLTTDYLCRNSFDTPLVARCNGGAQAGHTVETADGKRHVFGHIGAGTFANANTYLSRQFIVNPYALEKEVAGLQYDMAKMSAHPACRITLIYDMALNALRELSRGNHRHGSCGLGINETVTRNLAGYTMTLFEAQTSSLQNLANKINHIFNEYWKVEFDKIKWQVDETNAKQYLDLFENPNFMLDAQKLYVLKSINTTEIHKEESLIIEGAQGLMLDEHMGTFPHVTRSVTGLPSSILTAYELLCTEITPVYVTRCYLTRHGAGPLMYEGTPFTNKEVPTDKTNITGPWQGNFRYAPLDLTMLSLMINKDLHRSMNLAKLMGIRINKPQLMITCLDQVGDKLLINSNGNLVNTHPDRLASIISQNIPEVTVKYLSYGPTAADIKDILK